MHTEHIACRACGNLSLFPVADFGMQPLANDFRKPGESSGMLYPLNVLFCKECTLGQLSVVVSPDILYSKYSYVTSPSQTMVSHFTLLSHYCNQFRCSENMGSVLEIGSNNGSFLRYLLDWKFAEFVQGVEPAENVACEAVLSGIDTRIMFWNEATATIIGRKFDSIFARHVFAHVDDWSEFVRALELVSHSKTTVFIEVPSTRETIDRGEFDQVYHEHLSYVTTRSIESLLRGTMFYLHANKRFSIHGGSMVYVLKHRENPMESPEFEPEEAVTSEDWKRLRELAQQRSTTLRCRTDFLLKQHKRVFGFGAPAKAAIWANLCGFTSRQIEFIHDDTPQKQGCLLPGTDIPVMNGTERICEMDACVIFAWNFEEEIREKLKWWNGEFIKF